MRNRKVVQHELERPPPELTDHGRWVILTAKLPTRPSPPAGSYFWSVPALNVKFAAEQVKVQLVMSEYGDFIGSLAALGKRDLTANEVITMADGAGFLHEPILYNYYGAKEPNLLLSRRITYCNTEIVITAAEYNFVKAVGMVELIDAGVYTLIPETTAQVKLVNDVMSTEQRVLYEFALLEGANHHQALMAALGYDLPEADDDAPPPLGWYRVDKFYGSFFFSDRQMEETRQTELEFLVEVNRARVAESR